MIMILYTLIHTGQHCDQQPSERDSSHVGSRDHAPQHSSQAEGRDQHTITGNLEWSHHVYTPGTHITQMMDTAYTRTPQCI